jgi:uncharacterized membrane protein
MSDQTVIAPANNPAEGSTANVIYILYLVSFVVGITGLIGVIMAYVYQGAAPDWVRTHYRLQLRTFWIGLLYGIIGAVTAFIFVGWLVILFTVIWYIVRCVKGMQRINAGLPYDDPATWLW